MSNTRRAFLRSTLIIGAATLPAAALAQPADSTYGDPAVLAAAISAVNAALDTVAIRQGNVLITSFTVAQGAQPPAPPGGGFAPMLTPAPAQPIMTSGFLKVATEGLQAVQINTLPGTDWSAQVQARVTAYALGTSTGFGPDNEEMLNFLQWTVTSSGGTAQAVIRPPEISSQLNGAPDEGLAEFVAAIFGIRPNQVQIARPTSS
jgi:hypothetical protein